MKEARNEVRIKEGREKDVERKRRSEIRRKERDGQEQF